MTIVNVLAGVQTICINNQMNYIPLDTNKFERFSNFPSSSPGLLVVLQKVTFFKKNFSSEIKIFRSLGTPKAKKICNRPVMTAILAPF